MRDSEEIVKVRLGGMDEHSCGDPVGTRWGLFAWLRLSTVMGP